MENSFDNLVDNIAFEEADFFSDVTYAAGPGDEDEEKGEPEEEENNEGNESENPPLDPTIVHSPVPTQSGGKPPTTEPV